MAVDEDGGDSSYLFSFWVMTEFKTSLFWLVSIINLSSILFFFVCDAFSEIYTDGYDLIILRNVFGYSTGVFCA